MFNRRHSSLSGALFISSTLLLGACGGGGATATATVEATANPTAESSAATAEATMPSETTEPSVDVASPSFDLSDLTNNLSNVDSYRIGISVAGSKVYQATVISKPEKAEQISLGDGTDVTTIIKIGTDTWISTGGDAFQKDDLGMANSLMGAFDPLLLFGAWAKGDIAAVSTDLGSEQKNGVNAHHYRFDATSSLAGSFAIPAGAGLDFWVSDDGYLVAYAFTGTAADQNMSIDITNVNDPANKVERPS
jgi:hypothetical protein